MPEEVVTKEQGTEEKVETTNKETQTPPTGDQGGGKPEEKLGS